MLGSEVVTDLVAKGQDWRTRQGVPSEGHKACVWREIAASFALAEFQFPPGIVLTYTANVGHPLTDTNRISLVA